MVTKPLVAFVADEEAQQRCGDDLEAQTGVFEGIGEAGLPGVHGGRGLSRGGLLLGGDVFFGVLIVGDAHAHHATAGEYGAFLHD